MDDSYVTIVVEEGAACGLVTVEIQVKMAVTITNVRFSMVKTQEDRAPATFGRPNLRMQTPGANWSSVILRAGNSSVRSGPAEFETTNEGVRN